MDTDRLKGAAQDAGGKLQQGIGKLTGDDSLRAEGLAREAGGKVQGAFGELKDQARGTASDIRSFASDVVDHADDYARRGAEIAKEGVHAVERTVKTYPLVYLLLAGAFGFLAATILNDRGDRYFDRGRDRFFGR
jgi:uncharacterized protein YjbJ (UPF0337 family)